jgi:hypothetical protein
MSRLTKSGVLPPHSKQPSLIRVTFLPVFGKPFPLNVFLTLQFQPPILANPIKTKGLMFDFDLADGLALALHLL